MQSYTKHVYNGIGSISIYKIRYVHYNIFFAFQSDSKHATIAVK